MFESVLIANRGEIACRIIRSLRAAGIRSIAVYSDADADARHVGLADEAIRLGPASAAESYLNIERVIAAAVETKAAAIHPGYGFLAENAAFAAACADAGVVFIGPSVEAIRVMGDKISAKAKVMERGVPTVPGLAEPGLTDQRLAAAAVAMGFPILIKPSAGGGGKGMHVVTDEASLTESLAAARREAASSFGDDAIFIERYVAAPRHIEVQVLADSFGAVIHLGERECSLQRRHQKVIEEAPSPLLDEATRERIGLAACETARSVDYVGVGTVEFIVSADAPDEFFFMEMNTRLQVEHPVTEMVTGVDLVEWQLKVAAGLPLTLQQTDIVLRGHAVEARVYAEDPAHGFLPTGGRVIALTEPHGDGIRVDSALVEGYTVSSDYDPMLAKVIAWAPDRAGALQRLVRALDDVAVLGVTTNVEFLSLLLRHDDVVAGHLDTGLIERATPQFRFSAPTDEVLTRAALLLHALEWSTTRGGSVWDRPDGWRIGAHAPSSYRVGFRGAGADDRITTVSIAGPPRDSVVVLDGAPPLHAAVVLEAGTAGSAASSARIRIGGRTTGAVYARDGDDILVQDGAASWTVTDHRRFTRSAGDQVSAPELRSPMPGSIVAVRAEDGAQVAAGDPVIVVEAMKMEHVLRAPTDGVVALLVGVGTQVRAGELLATVATAATAVAEIESAEPEQVNA